MVLIADMISNYPKKRDDHHKQNIGQPNEFDYSNHPLRVHPLPLKINTHDQF